MLLRSTVAIALSLTCCTRTEAEVNLILNGGFEIGPAIYDDPNVSGDMHIVMGEGDTRLEGWVVHALVPFATIEYYTFLSPTGSSIDLCGLPGPGAISQTISTTPGQGYQVYFDTAKIAGTEAHTYTMAVSAAGQTQEFSQNTSAWTERNWAFTATDSQSTLTFAQVLPFGGNYGMQLDNVRVYAVPEPSSVMQVATALTIGFAFCRRFTQSMLLKQAPPS